MLFFRTLYQIGRIKAEAKEFSIYEYGLFASFLFLPLIAEVLFPLHLILSDLQGI